MSKKISLIAKPTRDPAAAAEAWVENRQLPQEPKCPMKRLTVDIDDELNQRMPVLCARERVSMVVEFSKLLEKRFQSGAP